MAFLLDHGATAAIRSKKEGFTALHLAKTAGTARSLLEKGGGAALAAVKSKAGQTAVAHHKAGAMGAARKSGGRAGRVGRMAVAATGSELLLSLQAASAAAEDETGPAAVAAAITAWLTAAAKPAALPALARTISAKLTIIKPPPAPAAGGAALPGRPSVAALRGSSPERLRLPGIVPMLPPQPPRHSEPAPAAGPGRARAQTTGRQLDDRSLATTASARAGVAKNVHKTCTALPCTALPRP